MKITITGSDGFVGRHLTKSLVQDGHNVTGYDHSYIKYSERDGFKQVPCNVLEDKFYGGADVVINLACAKWGEASYSEYIRTNITGTLRAMEYAKKVGARFICPSSAIVYGNPTSTPQYEFTPLRPTNAYGYSKILCEQACHHFRAARGLDCITLRFTSIYGPGQETQIALVPDVLKRVYGLAKGTSGVLPIKMFGTGHETRDWLYIDDAVAAYKAVLTGELPYVTYNVGTGVGVSVQEVADILLPLAVGDHRYEIEWSGTGNMNDAPEESPRALDWRRLKEIGWMPRTSLQEGLEKTVKDFREKYLRSS